MISASDDELIHSELAFLYAMRAIPLNQVPVAEAHITACAECQQEIEALRPIIASFVGYDYHLLFLAVAVIIAWIIPGYILRSRYKMINPKS